MHVFKINFKFCMWTEQQKKGNLKGKREVGTYRVISRYVIITGLNWTKHNANSEFANVLRFDFNFVIVLHSTQVSNQCTDYYPELPTPSARAWELSTQIVKMSFFTLSLSLPFNQIEFIVVSCSSSRDIWCKMKHAHAWLHFTSLAEWKYLKHLDWVELSWISSFSNHLL